MTTRSPRLPVPDPDSLPDLGGLGVRRPRSSLPGARLFQARPSDRDAARHPRALCARRVEAVLRGLVPHAGALPDDPLLHQAALAYASDMTLLDTSLAPHGRSVFEPEIQAASLDHALWLHRPFRADEWLLFSQDSPSASGARAFRGHDP